MGLPQHIIDSSDLKLPFGCPDCFFIYFDLIHPSHRRTFFRPIDKRDYGGFSGNIIDSATCKGSHYVIISSKTGQKKYIAKADYSGNWDFPLLPAGEYTVEAFCDDDNNGVYSYGSPYPFVFAERFIVFDKEVNIKPRWKVTDIKIRMSK